MDLDWEYPGVPERGSKPAHKEAFTKLVETLKAAYRKLDKPLLLSAAVAAGRSTVSQAYEIAKIAKVNISQDQDQLANDAIGPFKKFEERVGKSLEISFLNSAPFGDLFKISSRHLNILLAKAISAYSL